MKRNHLLMLIFAGLAVVTGILFFGTYEARDDLKGPLTTLERDAR